jgi:hypothetical protein
MCSLQGQADSHLLPLDPEYGDIIFLKNIRNHLPDDSISHPRRLEFNLVSSMENTVNKFISDGQSVSVLSVCSRYIYIHTHNELQVALLRMSSRFEETLLYSKGSISRN